MSYQRQRGFAVSLWIIGLLITVMSLGGGWGRVYGQTAGPPPAPAEATLSVNVTADPPNPGPGDPVTFTISITNTGDEPALNVEALITMSDQLEVGDITTTMGTVVSEQTVPATTFAAGTGGKVLMAPAAQEPTARVIIPRLDPGVTAIITIQARVREDASGTLTNQIIVRASNVDGVVLPEQPAQASITVGGGVPPVQLPDTGAGLPERQPGVLGAVPDVHWPLFVTGLFLLALGGSLFSRARRTS